GEISLIVVEQGASAKICATLREGEPVALMGPTGVRMKIPDGGETVMVVVDRLGIAHFLAVGPALRAQGNGVRIAAQRACDRAAAGSIVGAIGQYAQGALEPAGLAPPIPLEQVDRLIIVGGSRLVRRVRDAKRAELAPYFCRTGHTIASISTPMQCMLKGVCSQCLQWQIDPLTGKRTKAVFGCSWQDQPLEIVDLDNLDERLGQNRLQEALADLWLEYLCARHDLARA